MAIAIRSETTGGTTTSGLDGTFAVTKPATVANGDVLVVVVGQQDEGDITPPGDWTTGNEGGSATGNDRFGGIYYKKITNAAGEPSSYTFTSSGTGEQVGWWIGALSGVNPTTPQDVAFNGTGAWAALANDTSPNCPAVTTVTAGAFALACWAINTDSSITMPGGSWADRAVNVGGNGVLSVASQTFPTAGTSTGTPEVTNVDAGMESEVGMFVFRPDVGATGTLSATLASATGSATGTVAINGIATISLAAATATATGTVTVLGQLAVTLGDATLAGTGGPQASGTLSATLADVTLSGTGTVASPSGTGRAIVTWLVFEVPSTPSATGTADITLADATATVTGAVQVSGIASATLADATASAAGTVAVAGT